jgi:hypothetical protein
MGHDQPLCAMTPRSAPKISHTLHATWDHCPAHAVPYALPAHANASTLLATFASDVYVAKEEAMSDPNNNPNIYGTDAYRDRVELDKHYVDIGWGTPSTREGRAYANQLAQEQQWTYMPPPETAPTFPPAIEPTLLPGNATDGRDRARARQHTAGTPRSRGKGAGQPWLVNILSAGAGVLGVGFAQTHGVTSDVGLGTAFVVTFVAAQLVVRYRKLLVSIAVLGFLLYEVLQQFVRH